MKKISRTGKLIILSTVGILLIAVGVLLLPKESNEQFVVKLNYNNGTTEEKTITIGEKLKKPEDPVREGYIFEGWEVNGKDFNFDSEITGDVVIAAKWKKIDEVVDEEKYKVKFDLDNGSEAIIQEVVKGEKASRISDPIKDGYTFKYWDNNGVEYDFAQELTGDLELKAIYEVVVNGFTVTFDSDGGSAVSSQTTNTKVTKPNDPTKSGMVFAGWYLNNSAYDFDKTVTSDITLKAKWLKDEVYTITFNSNGGSAVENQEVHTYKTVKKPANPTKAGFTFKEWQLNGKAYNFNTKVTSNLTLNAVWDTIKYTVTFDSNGGSKVSSQSVEINKTAKKPSNPTREGYTFTGWNLNNQEFNFATPITGNITLKASWQINSYTVTFDTNGAGNIQNQVLQYGNKVTKPSDPSKDGYIFVEWQLNGKAYNFSDIVKSNMTLKAKFREKQYKFKVDIIDQYSPDRTISVYEEGTKINFSKILVDGVELCRGSNPTVNKSDIEGVSSVTVVLTSGTSVTAKLG